MILEDRIVLQASINHLADIGHFHDGLLVKVLKFLDDSSKIMFGIHIDLLESVIHRIEK